jgi:hypothetical protein
MTERSGDLLLGGQARLPQRDGHQTQMNLVGQGNGVERFVPTEDDAVTVAIDEPHRGVQKGAIVGLRFFHRQQRWRRGVRVHALSYARPPEKVPDNPSHFPPHEPSSNPCNSRESWGYVRRSELRPEVFGPLENHEACRQVLSAIHHLDCQMPCREGGGSSGCRIRECCKHKGINGCWECDGFESCDTLAWLNPVNQGANVENLRTIREKGIESFLVGEKLW